MAPKTLLVTLPLEPAQRETLTREVEPEIDWQFLQDLDTEDRVSAVAEADGLLSRRPLSELGETAFDQLHAGQVLQVVSSGVDHLPVQRLPEGLIFQNNAGAHAAPIAEHTLALYLSLSKRLRIEHQNLQQGDFNQDRPTRQIQGSVCGIFGYGSIGQATARLLKPLGVSILAINRSGEAAEPAEFLGTPDDLEFVLRRVDELVISAPLTSETAGVIDREKLRWMAPDAMLINVARGEILDQHDLYHHLRANPEFQAGIDAWWTEPARHGRFDTKYPFLELPNVTGSPHNSSRVPTIDQRRLHQAVHKVVGALTRNEFRNVVDINQGY